MQETAFVDSQGGLLSSRGGAQTHWHRQIGTSLTPSSSNTNSVIADIIHEDGFVTGARCITIFGAVRVANFSFMLPFTKILWSLCWITGER